MVSFQCDGCADTVKKPKLDQHRSRCHSSFTCLDCSTTFRNPSEYKGHTTCVSEAEKYQGALYRGPKKGQNGAQSESQTPAAVSSPAPPSAPTPADSSSSIHPSRLGQMNSTAPHYENSNNGFTGRGRGGARGGRGGRGGYQRGGFGGGGGGYAQVEKSYATSENKFAPPEGMRSWGGSPAAQTPAEIALEQNGNAPVSSSATATAMTTGEPEKKKNKRKGDKGGTGAKANSKNPRSDVVETTAVTEEEPKNKKRKFEESGTTPATVAAETVNGDPAEAVSSKTLKRLKKRFGKLEEKSNDMSLGDWIEALGKDKEKSVESAEILKAIKVCRKDGSFVLSL
ncbi:hypothetical protein I317_04972 [Kwoniella heveanensis CBS 569]|uniref:Zinc finger C2H2 LYAR-type domain-containing protein n=1 Tax=Kwoniella heveanensis BCC8398 TaxID=1296120 RepID=A0A1B9GWQ0_9TREE|nr:hypothetical protein I316_03008 [Kwoniella heveanensis BCC8398]OCF41226.1 hypothetical protein I317_04972 [Kwoniella heveanensis CBS 569]